MTASSSTDGEVQDEARAQPLDGVGEAAENNEQQNPPENGDDAANDDVGSGSDDATNDDGGDDETVIDPFDYAPTPEGLAAFVAAVDGLKSGEGEGADDKKGGDRAALPPDPKDDEVSHEYAAQSIAVGAGARQEVPVAVPLPGSRVSWEAAVEEMDANFSIRLVPVDGGNVTPAADATLSSADGPAMGNFVIDTPSTMVLSFDNSYSWITPKTVSYRVEVSPPIDVRRIRRAERALASVLKRRGEVEAVGAARTGRREQAERDCEAMDREMRDREAELEAAEEEVLSAEGREKRAEQSLREEQEQLREAEEHMKEEQRQLQELEDRMRELELERQVREEEARAVEEEIRVRKGEVRRKEGELAREKDEGQLKGTDLLHKREQAKKAKAVVSETLRARETALAEENQTPPALEFLNKQEEVLKARLGGQN